ncbi:IspD/TarI family cytidylyltransferase [Rhodococcoides kyotonense]|uniref:2-C-methyl-D-erythritol 4-phosphate cytidylyltransferase n=1 Tax=Rhodococcoides kyotonense TaxID=398843 RepID=A0A239FKK3_9NOCA|nr:IspD/TarI family cytidylyltransferase [Rhodococcus kyotonensis]SNS57301.1 2-C-methyl-D-erythritol 4-phosphate cytidylyltransferase [Rhodococcus kyotonensis]
MVDRRVPESVGVVLAAGKGTRVGRDVNKAYLPLAGRRMVSWTLESLADADEIGRILLVVGPADMDTAREVLRSEVPDIDVEIVEGGQSRHESEFKALEYLADDIRNGSVDVVLIHDAARPLAGPEMMRSAVSVAREFGGSVPALPATGLIEVDEGGQILGGRGPESLVRVQTPQAFRAPELLDAYVAAARSGFEGTDTSSCVEHFSELDVRSFRGAEQNFKVTYGRDLFLAEKLLVDNR